MSRRIRDAQGPNDNPLVDTLTVGSTVISETEIGYLDGLTAGASAASKALVLDANEELDWAVSTDDTGNVEPLNFDVTLTGAGATGGRAKFTLTTNVALGSWSNALKAQVTYGASGKTAGLGSAFVAEMSLEAGCVDGSYAPLEVELGMPEDAVTGTRTSLMTLNVYGHATGIGRFDDAGFLFDLNGINVGDAHLFATNQGTGAVNATHALRCQILGTTYYLPLHTANTFGNT